MSLYTIVLSTTIPVQWSPVRTDCPLLAKVFMSYIEENLEREGKLPSFYRRYVVDTLTIMPNIATASNSMDTHNKAHASVKFMMETDCNGMLPFLAIQVLNRSPKK